MSTTAVKVRGASLFAMSVTLPVERYVAAARTARGKEAASREGDLGRVEFMKDQPQRTQSVEALQPAKVIWLRAFNGIFRSALEVIHAKRDAVELASQRNWVSRAGAIGAAPVVQREENTRPRPNAPARAVGITYQHAYLACARTRRPFLRRDHNRTIALGQLGPWNFSG